MSAEWYFAKCEKCKEVANVMVKSPYYTTAMLCNQGVFDFLARHYGCELQLGWRDDQMDKLWEAGFSSPSKSGTARTKDSHPSIFAFQDLLKLIFQRHPNILPDEDVIRLRHDLLQAYTMIQEDIGKDIKNKAATERFFFEHE